MPDQRVNTGRGWTFAVLMIGSLSLFGCGSTGAGPQTYSVSGPVTYEGEPLAEGRILFRNLGGDGRGYSGEIKNGEYRVQCEAGKVRVEITASRAIPGKMVMSEDKVMVPVMQMYIPEKYNTKSTLKTTVKPESQTIPFALTK